MIENELPPTAKAIITYAAVGFVIAAMLFVLAILFVILQNAVGACG